MKTLEIREPPITLELAKQHLRVGSTTHDDALIAAKLDMAVAVAEDMTGRMIRERRVGFDVLVPTDTPIVRLPVPTSQIERLAVSQFLIPEKQYTLLEDDYQPLLITEPEYLGERISVTAVVGYNKDTIPPAIKAAILLILGTLYDNESDNLVGRSVSELSLTAEKLLLPWRVTPYGDV
nr:MAG TPA: Head Tail Connector Protein [Caudoviricetes sp.]